MTIHDIKSRSDRSGESTHEALPQGRLLDRLALMVGGIFGDAHYVPPAVRNERRPIKTWTPGGWC
ncbi:hypothetical protein [Rhodoplanes serenus]|uniref:hypothetical protein n=1 Tax=Rhodoplanes serenus TaxID=200615 RepID=UPI000DAC1A5F|nr:hypothetical protein [Rhodoplanes serenus]MBI5114112.1 hypothetical protein [Rhodovulum sp.]RAI28876.1 hypothetical protein CH340_23295 [Rhodoplanes serenus]